MCDLRDWSPEENGACVEEYRPSSTCSSSSGETLIKAESLQRAEEVIQGITTQIQPNYISEERRRAVIDYVQRLVRGCLHFEVFPFGSVPLKTYLPDGDIDLTAMTGMNAEEALANEVFAVLEREDQNPAAEFVVKDVQLIRAEVKLVKCIIQNIVVDISFNQLGGLCTLCFLEKVDHLIGKDHLFKRSIILIKAWCYYESRILGAHHGLISTYALETLVLYIFQLFHSSLNGPLVVLYKFLDYYSKFDWEKYCVSLNGPVAIASLPEIVVVEAPEHGDGELLLNNDSLKEYMDFFSVPSRGFGTNVRSFTPKNFNILDPLKENNNLGRSVSKGNFFRIRRAFCYGVQKLQKILSDQTVDIEYELGEIFSNTLDRHGSGQRPDVQDPIPIYGHNGFGVDTAYSLLDSCQEDHPDHDSEFAASNCVTGEQAHHGVTLHGEYQNAGISASEMTRNRFMNDAPRSSAISIPSLTTSDAEDFADNTSTSLSLHGDANDLTSRSSISWNGASRFSPLSSMECPSPIAKAYYVPHLYFSQLSTGEARNGDANQEHIASSVNEMTRAPQSHFQDTCSSAEHNRDENQLASFHDVPSPVGSKSRPSSLSPLSWSSEETHSGCPSTTQPISSNAASHEHGNSLFDLSGDYESQLNSLLYGRWCYEFALGSQSPQISLPYVPQFSGKNPWERSVQHKRNVLSQINANGLITRQPFYPINSPVIPGAPFTIEEATKPRGTGTYFPNANHYRDRHPTGRGMNHGSVRSPRNNGHTTPFENFTDRSREFSQTRGKPGPSEFQGGGSTGRKSSHSYSSGSSHSSEKHFESGSAGLHLAQLPETRRQAVSVSVSPPGSSANMSIPEIRPKTETGTIKDRTSLQTYRLKDEDDFPPLSESTGRG